MITEEIVREMFDKLQEGRNAEGVESFREYCDQFLVDNDIAIQIVGTIMRVRADIVVFGMPLADPAIVGMECFIAGVLCGRMEVED